VQNDFCNKIGQLQTHAVQQDNPLFDHLVGGREKLGRQGAVKYPGGLQVNDEFEFRRLHDRQIGRLLALENPTGIVADLAIRVGDVVP
jgi:hypothetical protein